MNGSEIARTLGINRSLIYKALEELSCKGAIAGLSAAGTTRYTALPLEEILDGVEKDFKSTCEFLRDHLGEAVQVPEMKNIWNVSGYGSIVRRASLMMQKAISIVQIAGKGQEIELFRAGLSRARRRGLEVERVTPVDEELSGSFPLLLLVDHRELLAGYIGRPMAPGQLEMPVIWTENPGIVRMAEVVFSFAHEGKKFFLTKG